MTRAQQIVERLLAEDDAAFRQWFGKSKVVDADGKPLVVYRGDAPGMHSFAGNDQTSLIKGNIFFTDNPHVAKRYAKHERYHDRVRVGYADPSTLTDKDGLYRAYLSLQKPLIVDGQGESWDWIPLPPELDKKLRTAKGHLQIDDLAAAAKKLGYDGLIVRNVMDQHGDGAQYVAFRQDQVRFTTGAPAARVIEALNQISALAPLLAQAAQQVYDEWQQDEEGMDEELGAGGICQDVAAAMHGVLSDHDIEAVTVDNGGMGDQHVWVIAKLPDGVYEVDIPPHVYERGSGYTWKKLPGVTIDPDDVSIHRLGGPETFENYLDLP